MRKFTNLFTLAFILAAGIVTANAQGLGAIAGTVTDQTGAVVAGANVTVKSDAGQQFAAVTKDSGIFEVPALQNGVYTVTVAAANFKTSVVSNVKVDLGKPTTVDVALEAGKIDETVLVTSGGEILQTETATVSSTITGRQIIETPITSRDALDLITLLPGTTTTGTPRTSTVDGLPKGALQITIDGVDVQDNFLKSSDGFFTYVRPRVDAIEEVTLSTSNPGAESSGDGAVQIQFATRRGTNKYNGGLFWQHRNTVLNADYWYNNRDKPNGLDANGKAKRSRNLLNQYGVHWSGPIPIPGFGEGVPLFRSGKDKAFFFVNYEEFRLPESTPIRARTVLTSSAQAGNYTYLAALPASLPAGCTTFSATQMQCTRNLYTVAGGVGLPSTPDPTVSGILGEIRSSLGGGAITPITNELNRQTFSFVNTDLQVRKFLATRFDVNVTQKNTVTDVLNLQKFASTPFDALNSRDSIFPGTPNHGAQLSQRNSNSLSLRTTLKNNLVNEARWATAWGNTSFYTEITPAQFQDQGGFNVVLSYVTSITASNAWELRGSPTNDFTDNLTWIKGNHTFTFGGEWKKVAINDTSLNLVVPQINFGFSSSLEPTAFAQMFSTTAAGNFPGMSATDVTNAANMYAMLTGRVNQYGQNAYLVGDNTYQVLTPQLRGAAQRTYGAFAQDSWKIKPSLTISYGLRWQPQEGYELTSGNYSKLANFNDVYGLSGAGNMYKPGTLTGRVPQTVAVAIGERATPTDYNNFAPSVGVVWSPRTKEHSLFRDILGDTDKSVFRGGFSRAFVREGTLLASNILGSNPGGVLGVSRSTAAGTMALGTLLRNGGNQLSPIAYPTSPAYPYTLQTTSNDAANAFDPNLRTGYVDSWSLGYQRELNKNTVVEMRYVGNRGKDLWRQYNINELNTIENGFASEFALAQKNYYLNRAAGKGNTFAYFSDVAGDSPLPIMMSYTNSAASNTPNTPGAYSSGVYGSATNVAFLVNTNPNVLGLAAALEGNTTFRANALANARPSNFFYVNPTTRSNGAFIVDNGEKSWYDAGTIEIRRRLSSGIRINASYSFQKGLTNAYATSAGNDQVNFGNFTNRNPNLVKTISEQDVRHDFKFDGTFDLPTGKGQMLFSGAHGFAQELLGGWSILPVIRWQSGAPIVFQNVQLVGMTVKDLQKAVGVYKGASVVTWLPDDIILNTQRAFDTNATTATGYGTTFGGGGAPQGRFIAPAGYGNCVSRYVGECGSNFLAIHGPGFFKVDTSVIKRFSLGEKHDIQLRVSAYDLLNHPNFRFGGWSANTVLATGGGTTFGQLNNTSAYQDVSTTNDPGGRIVEFMLRLNW